MAVGDFFVCVAHIDRYYNNGETMAITDDDTGNIGTISLPIVPPPDPMPSRPLPSPPPTPAGTVGTVIRITRTY